MRARHLAIVFISLFGVFLVLTCPLGLAIAWSGSQSIGLGAQAISGTIWSGQLTGAQFRGSKAGNVKAGLEPLSLLSGTARLRLQAASGRVTLINGTSKGIEGATLQVPLPQLGIPLATEGELRLQDVTMLFHDSKCIRAKGRISGDFLAANLGGPQVAGDLRCEGSQGFARLTGESAGTQIAIDVKISGDGSIELGTQVSTTDPAMRSALPLAGFEEREGAFWRMDRGRLGQTQS